MKNILLIITILVFVFACNTSKKVVPAKNETLKVKTGDTIKISGDNLEYDVVIIEPGFGTYLAINAKPKGFYNQNFLENRPTLCSRMEQARIITFTIQLKFIRV